MLGQLEQCPHGADQLLFFRRFDQIGIGADFQASHSIRCLDAGSGGLQDFDELRLRLSLEPPADIEAVDVRQIDVEEDEIRKFGGGHGECVGAVARFNDSVALSTE